MKENRKVYSKPDMSVMRYMPSDVVMAGCTYTAKGDGACLIGGQDTSEAFSGTYYIGSYNGTTYIIWNAFYDGEDAPDETKVNTYAVYIKSVYADATGNSWSSSDTKGWHIAEYRSSGWSGNAS